MTIADAVAALESRFAVLARKEFRGETTLTFEPGQIAQVCGYARDELGFDLLRNLCSVDNLGAEARFEVIYELCNLRDNLSLRLKTAVPESAPVVPSVSALWSAANWHEREVYDLMGIRFEGHPDLRRILMWDGYPHHPLRKDFPLAGRPSAVEEVAFSRTTPLEGGPFVTTPCAAGSREREPRSRQTE